MNNPVETRKNCGLMIETDGTPFQTQKTADGVLTVTFGDQSVTFYDDRIEIVAKRLLWHKEAMGATVQVADHCLNYEYKGQSYRLHIDGATLSQCEDGISMDATHSKIILYPQKHN